MLKNELDLCNKLISEVSPDTLKFHEYVVGSGYDDKKRTTIYRLIEVRRSGGQIVFGYNGNPYENEKILRNAKSLLYRGGSHSDTSPKRYYYFGDIAISVKDNKADIFKIISEFHPSVKIPSLVVDITKAFCEPSQLDTFWKFIETTLKGVLSDPEKEGLLSEKTKKTDLRKIFIHFDISSLMNVNQWYDIPGLLEQLDENYIEATIEETFEFAADGNCYGIKKSLFHTLASGDPKSDNQFVGFDSSNRNKSFSLDKNQLRLTLYHSKIVAACRVNVSELYSFRLIPSGENLSQEDILSYFDLLKKAHYGPEETADAIGHAEEEVKPSVGDPYDFDPIDPIYESTRVASITSFDLVTVRKESKTSKTIINLGELNNISRSSLRRTLREVLDNVQKINEIRKTNMKIFGAFKSLYQYIGKGERYGLMLMQSMLKIYRDQYYATGLTHQFIEMAQHNIRNDERTKILCVMNDYYRLKTAYMILNKISKGDCKMTESETFSMELGRNAARGAWPLFFVKKKILSQIGYLSTWANSLDSTIKLLNDWHQSIIMHKEESVGKYRIDEKDYAPAFIEAHRLILELGKEGKIFSRDYFSMGFLDEFHKKCYANKVSE